MFVIAKAVKKQKSRAIHRQRVRITAPVVFTLGEPKLREKLLQFLLQLEENVRAGKALYISFYWTRKMYADGTALFLAELSCLLDNLAYRDQVKAGCPADPIVRQLLEHLGLSEKLGIASRGNISSPSVHTWKTSKGSDVEGAGVENVCEQYNELIGDRIKGTKLYVGLSEAMTNAREHAYPKDSIYFRHRHRPWWMFSRVVDGTFQVAFCDTGLGIPYTIKNSGENSKLRGIVELIGFEPRSDSALIKAAFEYGRTESHKANKGKGLSELKKVLNNHPSGRVAVHSSAGTVIFDKASPVDSLSERAMTHSDRVQGTVITWILQLDK